ncbi:RES family NAD+ phosphorylase [Fibrella sp. HMF5335]|uniref:RES family NAD+ phosphorylase n=1 Tax=Fibrella rubiginis TaxID=2817060 RepID=A0A939GEH9_9BACT|nr:RES family NAD+ phosphorylase [Fibrella rubiginis]MBO0937647.1 RES family NAD+ phosphorylase [Fibrella rubiginis]
MEVYRLLKAPYDTDPLSVVGSELSPGRWNLSGQGLLYTASSPAQALLETMAHFETVPLPALPQLRLFVLSVDESLIRPMNQAALPLGWNAPGSARLTQPYLFDWIEDPVAKAFSCLGVHVPSAVFELETNYLFAPKHPAFTSIRQVASYPIRLDSRLWRL